MSVGLVVRHQLSQKSSCSARGLICIPHPGPCKQIFQNRNELYFKLPFVGTFDKQLGQFLRKRRGEMTYAQFSRKTGLPASTLHRLENGTQSITLKKLEPVLKRLKCRIADVFPD